LVIDAANTVEDPPFRLVREATAMQFEIGGDLTFDAAHPRLQERVSEARPEVGILPAASNRNGDPVAGLGAFSWGAPACASLGDNAGFVASGRGRELRGAVATDAAIMGVTPSDSYGMRSWASLTLLHLT
jgi:hypothetical protein